MSLLRRRHLRLRHGECEIPYSHRALVGCHCGDRLLIGLQISRHVAVDVESGRRRHIEGKAAGRALHGVDVTRHARWRRRAPGALVHDGEERGRRCHVPGPEGRGDHPHVRLVERGHRRGTAGGPGGEGGESVGGTGLGDRCPRDIGRPQGVEGVEGRRVVGRTTLGGLPLVEVGHVRRGGRRRHAFEDAELPARWKRREPSGLRGRGPAGRPGERAGAEARYRQGQDEWNASKDACHECSIRIGNSANGALTSRIRAESVPMDRPRFARSAACSDACIGPRGRSGDHRCAKHGCGRPRLATDLNAPFRAGALNVLVTMGFGTRCERRRRLPASPADP